MNIRALLETAYAEGFRDSAEGWNNEINPEFETNPMFTNTRSQAVDRIISSIEDNNSIDEQ